MQQALNLQENEETIFPGVEVIYIVGHNIMVAAPEGGVKTWLLLATAINFAAGHAMLGFKVSQCPVLILDEETPINTLESRLNRLTLGVGHQCYHDLPIELKSSCGFRFGSKTALNEIVYPGIKAALNKMPGAKHLLITMDSHIAMLGATSHSNAENQDTAGKGLDESLKLIHNFCKSKEVDVTVLIAAHAKKVVAEYDISDLQHKEMQVMVRGHGSIVGLGCDTGYVLKKISDKPLRGVLIPKPRRAAIDSPEIYWELQEESYGSGWARLTKIDPMPPPPSELAVQLYSFFRNNPKLGQTGLKLNKDMAIYEPAERKLAVQQLLRHRIILNTPKFPFYYHINHRLTKLGKVDAEYLQQLQQAYKAQFGKIK